jgi:hypothetical protein
MNGLDIGEKLGGEFEREFELCRTLWDVTDVYRTKAKRYDPRDLDEIDIHEQLHPVRAALMRLENYQSKLSELDENQDYLKRVAVRFKYTDNLVEALEKTTNAVVNNRLEKNNLAKSPSEKYNITDFSADTFWTIIGIYDRSETVLELLKLENLEAPSDETKKNLVTVLESGLSGGLFLKPDEITKNHTFHLMDMLEPLTKETCQNGHYGAWRKYNHRSDLPRDAMERIMSLKGSERMQDVSQPFTLYYSIKSILKENDEIKKASVNIV